MLRIKLRSRVTRNQEARDRAWHEDQAQDQLGSVKPAGPPQSRQCHGAANDEDRGNRRANRCQSWSAD